MTRRFTFISLLCVSIFYFTTTEAQVIDEGQPTQDSAINSPVVPGLQSPDLRDRLEFDEESATLLQIEEIPPALRKTLQDEEYRGWEQGKVYRNVNTQEYKVEMIDDP